MTRSSTLALAIALSLAAPFAVAQDAAPAPSQAQPVSENPFFAPSPLPYFLPQFDRIRDEHFVPALERGMAAHRAEVAASRSCVPSAPPCSATTRTPPMCSRTRRRARSKPSTS